MKIVCAGSLVRYPLGGYSWHHLQYLIGFASLGHEVLYVEDFGWENSCYDPALGDMTSDPTYGIEYLIELLRPHGLERSWCYLSADGTAHGLSRKQLAQWCRASDVLFNLSNINWIPEFEQCGRRALVDTDPVFTQIGGHGMSESFGQYDVLFSYGENVHKPGCEMPTAGVRWLPTRQPVALDQWRPSVGDSQSPFTTVMNWSAYGEHEYQGRRYGQKDREFTPYFSLPNETGESMEIALNGPTEIRDRLIAGGWKIEDPGAVTRDPRTYQEYLRNSRAEFSVAKHAYVSTRSGWFSDRTTGYLALGRPAVVQDTGFSDFLPVGEGLLAFRTPEEAKDAIRRIELDYASHCRAARKVIEECFDARRVLANLVEQSTEKAWKSLEKSGKV